jgi:tRNA pseudouridine55 synthase
LQLGATTPSYDLETEIDQTWSIEGITNEQVLEAAASFMPGYSQTAPMFSAKKVDGKVAYKAARKGKTLDIPPRYIEIKRFVVSSIELPSADFDVVCSKGTYIRSLVHDLGSKLNNGAHLTALRRYRSGSFDVADAMTVEGFEALLDGLPSAETA